MRTTHLLAVSATALLLSLTACSGGSDGDSPEATTAMEGGDAGGSSGDMAESAPEAPADAAAAAKDGSAARNAVDLTTQQALIKTGAVSLRSADVGATRYDVQVLVDEQGGQLAADETETDKSGEPLRARMVLRVPVDAFDDVMNALGSMETLASTSTSSEDVTTQLIDVEARIKAQTASVERVRQLLAQARSIRDIMAIESELAQRQAELDSLVQQQAYLKDQTSMATVKVNIERQPDPKASVTEDDDSGFLAGLAAGWDGLKKTVVAVATVVGALLPFTVLVLLVGVPVWLLVRRMRRTPPPVAAPSGE